MATREEKKDELRDKIVQAAEIYSRELSGKVFLYVVGDESFEVCFPSDHFRHLTGVCSRMSAGEFYRKAKNHKLEVNQFYTTDQHPFSTAQQKMKCLHQLPELTRNTVCVVKDMWTASIVYKLGLTNLSYQLFVQQAIKLKPRYVVMITPSRWFSGGWGLDEFRNNMMKNDHIRIIHDYQNSSDCFSGVEIKGGISYFLHDRDNKGPCMFYSHESDKIISKTERYLHEKGCDVIIRYNELINIYRKARLHADFIPFSSIVSGRSPFGLNTNHYGHETPKSPSDVKYFERKGLSYISYNQITKNLDAIKLFKLFVPKAAEDGKIPGKVIGAITPGEPGTICSGTYLLVGPFSSKQEMQNVASYMKTKFFRALVAVNKISQDSYAKVYDGVPMQDFSDQWTDEELYAKYGLTEEEIAFIESMIKPME